MREIHAASIGILKNIGVEMRNEKALKIMHEAGVEVDFRRQVARFPSSLVEETIKKVSGGEWALYGREGYKVGFTGREAHFYTQTEISPIAGKVGGFTQYVLDLNLMERREANEKDVIDSIRLADYLENIKVVGPSVSDQTLPPKLRIIHNAASLVNNTAKPGAIEVFTLDDLECVVRIASIAVGGIEELKTRPMLLTPVEATSPLRYSSNVLENVMFLAKHKLPITFYTMPIPGVSAPVTLAGAIALGNAEVWAGAVFAKLLNSEVNVGLGIRVTIFDQRTLTHSYAAPEHQLALIASLQLLNEFYNVSNRRVSGIRTDANFPGIQAGYEKAATGLSVLLAGATLVGNLGFLRSCDTFSCEQLVIDNEIVSTLNRYVKGFEVNEKTIAANVIEEVGIGGNFLLHKHTPTHLRSEYWFPELADRIGWDEWKGKGEKDALDKAKEKVKRILESHFPEPLDRDAQKEIQKIVKEADKRLLR